MKYFIYTLFLIPFLSIGQTSDRPIIDMHIHGYTHDEYIGRNGGTSHPATGIPSPATNKDHQREIIAMLDKFNIELAVLSGSVEALKEWTAIDKRFIPAWEDNTSDMLDIELFEQYVKEGKIKIFGEIMAVYKGISLTDSIYQPYLEICNKYDVPVAYHSGTSRPGIALSCCKSYRLPVGNPYTIEDILIRYPNLRIYLMHAGAEHHREAINLMHQYRNLYVDLGALLWIEPFAKYQGTEFLKIAKEVGFLDRVMYGSDPMTWPQAIPESIKFLNSLEFLTEEDKNMIFYENAVRFLKLDED